MNLPQLIETMKPIVEITEAIRGEKWVTISTVRPLLHGLLDDHLLCSDQDSGLMKTMNDRHHNMGGKGNRAP